MYCILIRKLSFIIHLCRFSLSIYEATFSVCASVPCLLNMLSFIIVLYFLFLFSIFCFSAKNIEVGDQKNSRGWEAHFKQERAATKNYLKKSVFCLNKMPSTFFVRRASMLFVYGSKKNEEKSDEWSKKCF